jgi:hypothetical protein
VQADEFAPGGEIGAGEGMGVDAHARFGCDSEGRLSLGRLFLLRIQGTPPAQIPMVRAHAPIR